jgi:hypothetical protein
MLHFGISSLYLCSQIFITIIQKINKMTLKELLDRCDFRDIAPFIVKIYPEHEHMLCDYKMAFDIL